MPVPVWLMRFSFNPEAMPLDEQDAEGIAQTLDHLATTLGVMAVEYRKGEHRTAHLIEVGVPS